MQLSTNQSIRSSIRQHVRHQQTARFRTKTETTRYQLSEGVYEELFRIRLLTSLIVQQGKIRRYQPTHSVTLRLTEYVWMIQ